MKSTTGRPSDNPPKKRGEHSGDRTGLSTDEITRALIDNLHCLQAKAPQHATRNGVALDRPDWSDHSHALAFTLRSLRQRFLLHGMLNAYWEPLTFQLPAVPTDCHQTWRRCIDTARASPDDILLWNTAPLVEPPNYVVQAHSGALLALALPGSTGNGAHAR